MKSKDANQNFFHERYADISVLSKNPLTVQSLPRFSNAFKAGGFDDSAYKQVDTYYGPLLEHFLRQFDYHNIFFADTDGNVCFGVKRDEYIGTNLKTGKYNSFTIGEIFKEGLNNIKFSDLTWCEEAKDFILMAAAPVYDLSNKLLGTVIVEMPYACIDIILTQRDGLGDTGEIYIVGDDHFMRSKSRFITPKYYFKTRNQYRRSERCTSWKHRRKGCKRLSYYPCDQRIYTPRKFTGRYMGTSGGNGRQRGLFSCPCP